MYLLAQLNLCQTKDVEPKIPFFSYIPSENKTQIGSNGNLQQINNSAIPKEYSCKKGLLL